MKAKKFDLFMGCLGNGITVCNAAVEEHGDYKQIAHISEEGKIKWYVKADYCPAADLERIERAAAEQRKKFIHYLRGLSDEGRKWHIADMVCAGYITDEEGLAFIAACKE